MFKIKGFGKTEKYLKNNILLFDINIHGGLYGNKGRLAAILLMFPSVLSTEQWFFQLIVDILSVH